MSTINLQSKAIRTRIQEPFWNTTEAEFIASNDYFASPEEARKFQSAAIDIIEHFGGQASETDIRRELAQGRYCHMHGTIPRFILPSRFYQFPLSQILATLGFTVHITASLKSGRHTGTIVTI